MARKYDKQAKAEYDRIYRKIHKEKRKEYLEKNKDKIAIQQKLNHQRNKAKIAKYMKKYNKKYRDSHKEEMREYEKNRKKNNLNYRLAYSLRNRIRLALKNNQKSGHTMDLLGYSIKQLKEYLEKQFKSGMSFSNYGKWHIDHIIPCAKFNLTKESEQRKCFHYTNLQPLWAKENLEKGYKLLKGVNNG